MYDNASLGDALFSGTPSGAGGVTISAGADNYRLDHNWVAGNLSTGDGGGVVHSGLSFNGTIDHNYILFNQSTDATLPTNGGGLGIIGANGTRTLANGIECNSAEVLDCPPGLGDGTGANLMIDSNLIIGNSAESGSGGGVRLQQVNGTEVVTAPYNLLSITWYGVTVQNNIIANNVAGWDGAGVSMEDALKVTMVNNTIVSNDTTASAGVLFKTLGAVDASSPPPGCNPTTDLTTNPQDPNCLLHNAAHIPQPAGLVTMRNTPNLVDAMNGLPSFLGVRWLCPSGYGYSGGILGIANANCGLLSLPRAFNDMFWQNRAFHVEITGAGTGLQSQQNLVSLLPTLNQAVTGQCAAGASYWDVGVRDDTGPTNHNGGATLSLRNSILTSLAGGYTGNGNRAPSSSPVNAQYCNGSRVPPENGGHGYLAPPGRSETTGLSTLFVFNNGDGGRREQLDQPELRPSGVVQQRGAVDAGHRVERSGRRCVLDRRRFQCGQRGHQQRCAATGLLRQRSSTDHVQPGRYRRGGVPARGRGRGPQRERRSESAELRHLGVWDESGAFRDGAQYRQRGGHGLDVYHRRCRVLPGDWRGRRDLHGNFECRRLVHCQSRVRAHERDGL